MKIILIFLNQKLLSRLSSESLVSTFTTASLAPPVPYGLTVHFTISWYPFVYTFFINSVISLSFGSQSITLVALILPFADHLYLL